MLSFTEIPEYNKEIIAAQQPVKVLFRKWKKDGSIIAIFPELPGTQDATTCECYEHNGQHGAGDPAYIIQATTLAKPEEFADLKSELERIGYSLKVYIKYTYSMQQARFAELRRLS